MYTVFDGNGVYQLATLDDAISCAQLENTKARITKDGEFVADFDGKETWTVAAKYAPVWRTFSEEETVDEIESCKCCGAILFQNIDPENICMTCVDMECNVND